MRVLFLSTWFPFPPDNGSKLRVLYLIRELARRHDVTLLSFAFDTARLQEASQLAEWCRAIRTIQINPFEHNQAGALRRFASLDPVFVQPIPAMAQLVGETLQSQEFDAVIASVEVMATYAQAAPATTAKILEEHNSLTRWMHDRQCAQQGVLRRSQTYVSWQKARRYEARLFPRFDLVTVVSGEDRAASLDLPRYRGRVEVVPNGVDCEHNRPGLAAPKPLSLVFNGALTYDANFDAMQWFLADIYPKIRLQTPDVFLSITGSTRGVDLAKLPIDTRVLLTGYVEDVRVPVAEASICVVPIRQGGGTRLKILEAMALGIPVVATSKGAEGLDVVDREHLLIADDPSTFAEAVITLFDDADLRCRLVANARHLVEQTYDWRQIGSRFTYLVEETVEIKRIRSLGT